jgi:hypothetical protein
MSARSQTPVDVFDRAALRFKTNERVSKAGECRPGCQIQETGKDCCDRDDLVVIGGIPTPEGRIPMSDGAGARSRSSCHGQQRRSPTASCHSNPIGVIAGSGYIVRELSLTFRELARTRTQRRESYLSPPNGFSVALSLNSAGRLISEGASLSVLL